MLISIPHDLPLFQRLLGDGSDFGVDLSYTKQDSPDDVVARAETLKPSSRGELEITDLNNIYLSEGRLRLRNLGRGMAWFDTGTHDSLQEASAFVAAIEKRQGFQIACQEEIALQAHWITPQAVAQCHGRIIKGPFNKEGRGEIAVIHHYWTKSYEEWINKTSIKRC